jgi:hypothetical protein
VWLDPPQSCTSQENTIYSDFRKNNIINNNKEKALELVLLMSDSFTGSLCRARIEVIVA